MIKSAGILNPWFPCHVIAIAEIEIVKSQIKMSF